MNKIKNKPIYKFLLTLTMASAVGLHGWRTLFNNFAVEVVGANGFQVGLIQSFREVPGFLAFAAVFLLGFLKEHRLSALSVICLGSGIFFTGFFPSIGGLLAATVIMSLGFHYYETTNQSLILQNFDEYNSVFVMGNQRSIMALVCVVVGVSIFFLSFICSFKMMFIFIGSIVLATGFWGLSYDHQPETGDIQHRKIILKKEYGLFYLLTFLSGSRRQIFMVFSVLLLVKKFNFSLQSVTILFVVNNIINYFAAPLIARSIKRFGERLILTLEYSSLIVIFAGYAFCPYKWVVAGLYILDHISFNGAMAIRTYFQKIAHKPDIASSTAVSFTINHLSAVVLPVIGGYFWMINPKIPFLGGIFLSACSLVSAQYVKVKPTAILFGT
ncbi:MAG: MFS transporter [Candidatus Omnitrophica bacterium]|nr:MFS transporter [Candidatus Omnitrophota bacterium]